MILGLPIEVKIRMFQLVATCNFLLFLSCVNHINIGVPPLNFSYPTLLDFLCLKKTLMIGVIYVFLRSWKSLQAL